MLMHDQEEFELFLQSVETLEESNEPLPDKKAKIHEPLPDEMERMKGQHRTEAFRSRSSSSSSSSFLEVFAPRRLVASSCPM